MGKMKEEFMRMREAPIIEEETCETCAGGGEMERLCDCGEWVTLIMGQDAKVCEECANE